MSRKGGCPFNIRDYSVSIKNPVTGALVRVKGLDSMSVETGADTEDGRTAESLWAEMFIKGRSASGTLSGRPIADRATGAKDPGQALLHRAAFSDGGCENDQTLVIADAIGRAVAYDCVVTKESVEVDEDGEAVSWEWEGVGRPEAISYVQAEDLGFEADGAAAEEVTLAVNATAEVKAVFEPADASNQRFSYCMADEAVAEVVSVEDGAIVIRGVSPGETTLTLRSMNNGLTASLAVGVTAG